MKSILDIGLTNALLASLLAVVAVVAGRFRIRPALRHGLWLLVLLKLIAPPLWPVRLPVPARTVPEPVVVPFVDPGPFASSVSESVGWSRIDHASPIEATEVPSSRILQGISWRMIVMTVWLGGSILWLSLALVRIARFRRVLRIATPADETTREHVGEIASRIGLRRIPRTVTTPGVVSPLVWGFGIVAKLLIPNVLWTRLDHGQRTTLLIHELAHLRRCDHLVRWLELVATALYWWHPVVWLARRAIRDAEEQCCDAWVVWAEPGSARSYATALLETVEFLSQSPGRPFAATGLGRVDHLKRRLTMILRGTTPRGLSWTGGLAILGLAGVLLPLSPIGAQEEAKDEPHRYIKRLEVIPTVTGEVTIQEVTPVVGGHAGSAETTVEARDATQEESDDHEIFSDFQAVLQALRENPDNKEAILKLKGLQIRFLAEHAAKAARDGKSKAEIAKEKEALVESLIAQDVAKLQEQEKSRRNREIDNLELAKLSEELLELRKRQEQLLQRMRELKGRRVVSVTADGLRLQDKDGSVIVFQTDGGKPGPQAAVRRLRIDPDGVPSPVTEGAAISAEEQSLREQEAAARKVLEAYGPKRGRGRVTDPAMTHAQARLAEIHARLQEFQDRSLRLQQQVDVLAVGDRAAAANVLRERIKDIEARSQGRYDFQNDPAYKLLKSRLAEIEKKDAPASDPDRRIDALEKKLDSVLDELKRLKGDENTKDKSSE